MHCSLSVRMKRSATPLHSGSPTYEGEIVHPSHFTSLIQASAMYCGPQSQRIANPRATSLPNWPKACRTPWSDLLAVMLNIAYKHPRDGKLIQIRQAIRRDEPFTLHPRQRVELVCWGVMPSGMLRHPLFVRWS